MNKTLSAIAAVLSVATMASADASADASAVHPLVTDPQGDAPAAVDILSADVSADAAGFTVTLVVDDIPSDAQLDVLDMAPGAVMRYGGELVYGSGWFDVALIRSADGSIDVKAEFHTTGQHGPMREIGGTAWSLDTAADTVTFTLPFSAVNAVLTSIGEPAIGLGSTVNGVFSSNNSVVGPPAVVGDWGSDATAWSGAYSLGD